MAEDNSLIESQLIVQNLGENSSSIAEQWRNLQASLVRVQNSLTSRVNDFDSDDKEIGGNVSGDQCCPSKIDVRQKLNVERRNLGRQNKLIDVKENVGDLREKLNAKRRSLSRGDGDVDDIDVRSNVGDLRGKLNVKGRSLGRDDEMMDEIDMKGKLVDLGEKFNVESCSLSRDSQEDEMVDENDVRRKFVDLTEKLKGEERCSLGQEGKCYEKKSVIELCNELYALLESKERRVKEECGRLECKEKLIDSGRQALELKEKDIDERYRVIGAKEIDIDRWRESVASKERDLEVRVKNLDKQNKILGAKEKKAVKYRKKLDLKEKNLLGRLELKEKLVEERWVAIESVEKKMEERCVAIKVREETAMSEVCKAVEWRLRQMNVRFDEMDAKEKREKKCNWGGNLSGKQTSDANERLILIEKEDGECGIGDHCQAPEKEERQIVVACEALVCTDTQVNNCIEPRGFIEKQINDCSNGFELMEKEVRGEVLETKEVLAEECIGNVTQDSEKLKKTHVNSDHGEVELKQKPPLINCDERDSLRKSGEELETKEVMADECIGNVTQDSKKLKKTHVNSDHGEVELKQKPTLINFDERDSLKNSVPMNGKALQTYLNKRADKHESMGEKIKSMLQSLNDPAKVVLDSVDGFYGPPINHDESAFELRVVRSSCLLLLEQLMSIKPLISERLKQEAETVALKWMSNMTVEGSSDILVLGFLLLVGSYHLFASFSWQTLERLCEVVDHHKLAPQLRARLCLAAKKHGVTQTRRKLPPSNAHRLVCSSVDRDLSGEQINDANKRLRLKEKEVDECGIGDNCQDLEKEEKQVNAPCENLTLVDSQVNEYIDPEGLIEKKINASSVQLKSKEKEVSDQVVELRAKHIHGYSSQLEADEAPMTGEDAQLENTQIGNNDKVAEECISDASPKVEEWKETHVNDNHEELELKQKPLSNCDKMSKVDNYASKGDSFVMLVSGKVLQTFLNERADKHESMGELIKSLLRSSRNPAKVALDAVDGFFLPPLNQDDASFELSVVRSSCLLILEQLMSINPVINEDLKLEAESVAIKWMSNMRVEGMSAVLVLGLLLLVGSYNLISSFPWEALEGLCEMVDKHKLAPQLRQRLCFHKSHDVTCSRTQTEKELSHTVPHDVVCSTIVSSSVEDCSDIHMMCKEMDAHGVRSYMIRCVKEHNILHDKMFDALRCASDPGKLVLVICRTFFETVLNENDSDAIKISCIYLLEQLIKLSPRITPDVECEARAFAVVWKQRLNSSGNFPMNHFVFLHFVAAYKLARFLKVKQLLGIFKSCYFMAKMYPPEKNVALCCALGLQDKMPDFVRKLIKQQKHLEAVKCISLLKMECDFPPVPLLEASLELVKQKVDEKHKKGSFIGKVSPGAIELPLLRNALNSILSLKLPFVFPTDSVLSRITQLEEEIKAESMPAQSLRKRHAIPTGSSEQLQKRSRTVTYVKRTYRMLTI